MELVLVDPSVQEQAAYSQHDNHGLALLKRSANMQQAGDEQDMVYGFTPLNGVVSSDTYNDKSGPAMAVEGGKVPDRLFLLRSAPHTMVYPINALATGRQDTGGKHTRTVLLQQ